MRALARRAVELGSGHVDILVNNAGVFPFGPTQGASDEDIDTVYAVNVKAPFILTGELAPAMAARGKGSIINVLTMVAHFGVAWRSTRLSLAARPCSPGVVGRVRPERGQRSTRSAQARPAPRAPGVGVLDQLAALAPAGRPAAPEIASAISYLVRRPASSTARSSTSTAAARPLAVARLFAQRGGAMS